MKINGLILLIRTLAFKRSKNKSDYILVIDADDRLIGDLNIPTDHNYTSFNIQIRLNNLEYYRKQFLIVI